MSERFSSFRTVLGVIAFLAVLAVVGTYFVRHVGEVGQVDDYHWGLADFRDAVYYPCRAVRDGVNPYDPDAYRGHFEGKVRGTFKLYSPLTFALFLPLAMLPFHAAGYVFTAVNLLLLLACAALSLRWCGWKPTIAAVFGLGALILASQPGQTNLNFGQVTWPLVLGSYLALALSRQRPEWSGAALALASFKPTYAVVVGFVMICRGDFRAVAYGVVFSVLGAVAGLGLMIASGVDVWGITKVLESNQREFYADPAVDPMVTPVRVDVPVLLVKAFGAPSTGWINWLPALVVMSVTSVLVWRETRNPGNLEPASLATFLLCLGIMVGVYHLVYDILFLALPFTALFLSRHPSWKRLPKWGVILLRVLAFCTAFNFLWTGPGVRIGGWLRNALPEALLPTPEAAWHFATLVNPLLLALLWCLTVGLLLLNSFNRDPEESATLITANRENSPRTPAGST